MCKTLFFCCAAFLALSSVSFGLRIATFNVDNYLTTDRIVDGRWRPAYPKPEAEKEGIRKTILYARPDILVLQEIGSLKYLEELRADLSREGLDYTYAVHLSAHDEERHIAFLSKLLPSNVVKHTDLNFKYLDGRENVKRGMLEATFQAEGSECFRIFAVHLKSRWTNDERDPESALRRVREAEACRNRILETVSSGACRDYLVAGDFNDHPRSSALRRFCKRGDLELGSFLGATDARGHKWTYFYQKHSEYSAVDGFVVSNGLKDEIKSGQAYIVELQGEVDGSDHRMVYLDMIPSDSRVTNLSDSELEEKSTHQP